MAKTKHDHRHSARERARELFNSKHHNCAESVFLAINEVFKGGLAPETAARIATGLGGGLGATGGTCGALTGGVLAIGLIAGADPAVSRRKKIYPLAAVLQKRFIHRFGTICCRELTRNLTVERRAHCSAMTAAAAEMCADILLKDREHSTQTE
jgi:C_GCAxxG_C_C family probable redox protein